MTIQFSLSRPAAAPSAVKKEAKETKFNVFNLKGADRSSAPAKSAKSATTGIWKPPTQFVSSQSSGSLGLLPSAPSSRSGGMDPRHLTNLIKETREALKHGDWKSWVKVCKDSGTYFNAINVAAALHTVASYLKKSQRQNFLDDKENASLVHELVSKINQEAPYADPWNIAQCVYACAKLRIKLEDLNSRHPELFTRISASMRSQINNCDAQTLASTIWAYARLGKVDNDLFLAIAKRATAIIDKFTKEDLKLTAEALAKLDVNNEHLNALRQLISTRLAPVRVSYSSSASSSSIDERAMQVANHSLGKETSKFNDPGYMITCLNNTANDLKQGDWRLWNKHCGTVLRNNNLGFSHVKLAFSVARNLPERHQRRFISENRDVLDGLVEKIGSEVASKDPRDIAEVVHAWGKLGLDIVGRHPQVLDTIIQATKAKIGAFNTQDLSMTAWGLSKLGKHDVELMAMISAKAQEKIQEFAPEGLSMIAYAFALLGIKDTALFTAISAQTQTSEKDFPPLSLGNIAWAFATLRIRDNDLFDNLAKRAILQIGKFQHGEISNLSWAIATLELGVDATKNVEQLLKDLRRAATNKIKDFAPVGLVNTLCAFVHLGMVDKNFLHAVANEACNQLNMGEDFDPSGLSRLVQAFATCGYRDVNFLRIFVQAAQEKMAFFNPQDLSMTAWALGTLEYQSTPLMTAIANRAMAQIQNFESIGLHSLGLGFSRLVFCEFDDLNDAIAREIIRRAPGLNGKELAHMAWVLAELLHDDKNAIGKITEELLRIQEGGHRKLDNCGLEEISELLHTLAQLRIPHPELLQAIKNRIEQNLSNSKIRELSYIAWNLMLYLHSFPASPWTIHEKELDFLYKLLLVLNAQRDKIEQESEKGKYAHYNQINSIMLFLGILHEYNLDEDLLPLREQCTEFLSQVVPKRSSNIHLDIQDDLEKLLRRKLQAEYPDEGFYMDIVLDEQAQIAFDVQGPKHFLRSGRATGRDLFRLDILEALDWKLFPIIVKGVKWKELWKQEGEKAKEEFLLSLLPEGYAPPKDTDDDSGDVQMSAPSTSSASSSAAPASEELVPMTDIERSS